jgi:hypothetical protein
LSHELIEEKEEKGKEKKEKGVKNSKKEKKKIFFMVRNRIISK